MAASSCLSSVTCDSSRTLMSVTMDMGHLMSLTEIRYHVHDETVLFIVAGPAAWIASV
jgi:hypothetical protein